MFFFFFCHSSGKTAHRLTLFYLCNDVVQNCKKKQAKIYMDTFKGVLKDAAPFVRYVHLFHKSFCFLKFMLPCARLDFVKKYFENYVHTHVRYYII